MVSNIVGRHKRGKELYYEIEWEGLDAKQNTHEPSSKLRLLGVETFARAFDERQAAAAAGVDQRPLSEREIVNHLDMDTVDQLAKSLTTFRGAVVVVTHHKQFLD